MKPKNKINPKNKKALIWFKVALQIKELMKYKNGY